MAGPRTGVQLTTKNIKTNQSMTAKILAKMSDQDYKGWKVHAKNLKTTKADYSKNRNETFLNAWQTACDNAQTYLDGIQGGIDQQNTKIKSWKKKLIENRWDIQIEYLIKAEHAFKRNKENLDAWQATFKNANEFINQLELIYAKIGIKPDQFQAWKDILTGHSQRLVKAKLDIPKKTKPKLTLENKSTSKESKKPDPIFTDKSLEAFLYPETTPTLENVDEELKAANTTQGDIQRIYEVGNKKYKEILSGDLSQDHNKPSAANPPQVSPHHSPDTPQDSAKETDKMIAAQEKLDELVKTLADTPTVKKSTEDLIEEDRAASNMADNLDKHLQQFTKQTHNIPKEDSGCCCSCWPFFKSKKRTDEDQYSYQRLPGSPKATKSI